jgi:ABC-type multidrug transport system ATPase subunit
MLKKIQKEGITIVVSTPYMDEAEMCDRVALMQKGRVLDISEPGRPDREEAKLLYSLQSSKGVYAYLDQIRGLDACKHAWLFGDSLHVTLRSAADEAELRSAIMSWGDPGIRLEAISPSIEDRFMGLMEQEREMELGKGETG